VTTQQHAVTRSQLSGGLWLALITAAAFGTSGTFASALVDTGWSPGAAVSLRLLGATAALLIPGLIALRGRWSLLRRNAGLIVAYGLVAMAACQLFYFNAVTTLSVGVALLLEYLAIVLVVLWLWVRHHQRPRRWTILGIVLSISGLLLVLDVTGGMRIDLDGVMWGLGAAVGLAVFFVLSAKDETGLPPIVLAASGMAVATVALLLAGLVGAMPLHFSSRQVMLGGAQLPWWTAIVALCLISTALAYCTGIAATRRLGSKVASFVGLTEVLFSVLFAWLMLGQLPMLVQLLGGALIIGGVVAVRYEELTRAAEAPVAVPLPQGEASAPVPVP
jgi:drug/metabolite transporter (DMT)-like permease